MHFYNFNIKDYRAKTAHLTPTEHYVYRSLIDWYYLNEKPFESVEQIKRLLMLDDVQAIENVLSEFFNKIKGKYHHKRINREIKNYRYAHKKGVTESEIDVTPNNADVTGNVTHNVTQNDRVKALRNRNKLMIRALQSAGVEVAKGIKTNDLKQLCETHNIVITDEIATQDVTLNEINVTQVKSGETDVTAKCNGKNEARTNNHKPITNKLEVNISFVEFWNAYDKKVGDKTKLERKWNSLSDSERLAVMEHIPKYIASQPDKQFRKNPETYLNQKSWNDEIITSQPVKQNFGVNHATHQSNSNETVDEYQQRLHNELRELGYDIGQSTDPRIINGDYRDIC